MNAGIRTPAEVIALAIEDAGIASDQARVIAGDAARRLAKCLQTTSRPWAEVIIRSVTLDTIEWGTVVGDNPEEE